MAEHPTATGVILSYRRIKNLRPIVCSMAHQPWIKEIIVWNNDCDHSEDAEHELDGLVWPVRFVHSATNLYTLGRYKAAGLANGTELIATCDDDVLVAEHQWKKLYERHVETGALSCILESSRAQFAENNYVHNYNGGVAYETLVGWGSVFRRSDITVLDIYKDKNGEDELLRRKADRLFTILLNHKHECLFDKVRHLDGATGEMALYRMKDHWQMNKRAADVAKQLLELRIDANSG